MADATLGNLHRVDSIGVSAILPPRTTTNPIAVAFDPTTQEVFWTDIDKDIIAKYSLINQTITELFEDLSGTSSDLIPCIGPLYLLLTGNNFENLYSTFGSK